MYSHAQHQEALVHSQKYTPIRSYTGREDKITHVEPEDLHTQTHKTYITVNWYLCPLQQSAICP